MNHLLERLQKRPLLGDGAMGTLLFSRGIAVDQCLEALVVEQPALIAAIHEEYARAGADVITTHTFGANRLRLAHFGLQERVGEFNRSAVELAHTVRAAMGRGFLIAGNVGPVGRRVNWEDAAEASTVEAAFTEQIETLAASGVDLLLFETFSDVQELEVAVRVAKRIAALPIVASMSFNKEGQTLVGQRAEEVARRLVAVGAEVIGANCSVGPTQMAETLRAMQNAAPDAIVSVSPNAGLPTRDDDGQLHYPVGAAEFAQHAGQFLALGARMVGGCCGTTPAYVALMREMMDDLRWGM